MNLKPITFKLSRMFWNFQWPLQRSKGPATRNDFVNDIVNDRALDAIFATLKAIVDDEKSTISSTISLRVAGPLLVLLATRSLQTVCLLYEIGRFFSSSSSYYCAGQRLTPHYRTLEVRPGRITKKLVLKYDYDCERDDTNSLLGVLMFGWDVVIANNE